jgi:hypothetical protein
MQDCSATPAKSKHGLCTGSESVFVNISHKITGYKFSPSVSKMNKHFVSIFSLAVLTTGVWLNLGKVARADHSLANVLSSSSAISQSVAQIQSFNNVVCDTENSNQAYYYPSERGKSGSAWKQIALCFKNRGAMIKAQKYFQSGGLLGFYGAPEITGVLVVAYTWENQEPAKLISINYL